jgi:DNA-binding NarL/FixJ family response regulator
MTLRVLIVDDEQLVRTGLRMILDAEDDLVVVGEAANGREALEHVREHAPDVVLMDIRMPGIDGLEATRRLCADGDARAPKVVILTTFDLDEHVYEALRAGASGFLLKDVPAHQLVHAIRVAAAGDALLAPSITRRLIASFTRAAPPRGASRLEQLTPRENEVLTLLAEGLSNHEIATRLFVGDATVKTHVASILTKLRVRDRVQAVVVAYRTGLVATDIATPPSGTPGE